MFQPDLGVGSLCTAVIGYFNPELHSANTSQCWAPRLCYGSISLVWLDFESPPSTEFGSTVAAEVGLAVGHTSSQGKHSHLLS